MWSPVLSLDCLDGVQISSLVTLKEHTEVITKSLTHLSVSSLFHGKSLRQYLIASSEQIDLGKPIFLLVKSTLTKFRKE